MRRPSARGRSDLRAAIENSTLLVITLWACSALSEAGHVAEARALGLLAISTVLARMMFELPLSWIRDSRTCPDTGLMYGTMCLPLVLSSKLAASEHCQRYLSFNLWACLGASAYLLASSIQTRRKTWMLSMLRITSVALASAFSWRRFSSCPEENSDVSKAAMHVILVLSLFEGLLVLCRTALARSFSVGEGALVSQALALAAADFLAFSLRRFEPSWVANLVVVGDAAAWNRRPVDVALQGGLLGVLSLAGALSPFFWRYALTINETKTVDPRRRSSSDVGSSESSQGKKARRLLWFVDWSTLPQHATLAFYAVVVGVLGGIVSPWCGLLLGRNPVLWVAEYTFSNTEHLWLVAFWCATLGVGLPMIHFVATRAVMPLIILRKLYHLLALLMFAPSLLSPPRRDFLMLSFGVASALLLLVEYIRICRVPPFGAWLHRYMRTYTDSRDEGAAILTHLYLLVGCASPLWLLRTKAGASLSGSIAPAAGLLILGAGDAAGAIVGSSCGRMRWPGGRKTVEGTSAAVLSTLLCSVMLAIASNEGADSMTGKWLAVLQATLLTCLLEAFTKQIDNLVLPLVFAATLELAQANEVNLLTT